MFGAAPPLPCGSAVAAAAGFVAPGWWSAARFTGWAARERCCEAVWRGPAADARPAGETGARRSTAPALLPLVPLHLEGPSQGDVGEGRDVEVYLGHPADGEITLGFGGQAIGQGHFHVPGARLASLLFLGAADLHLRSTDLVVLDFRIVPAAVAFHEAPPADGARHHAADAHGSARLHLDLEAHTAVQGPGSGRTWNRPFTTVRPCSFRSPQAAAPVAMTPNPNRSFATMGSMSAPSSTPCLRLPGL